MGPPKPGLEPDPNNVAIHRTWKGDMKAWDAFKVYKFRCYKEISLRVEMAYKQPLHSAKCNPKAAWHVLQGEYGHIIDGVQTIYSRQLTFAKYEEFYNWMCKVCTKLAETGMETSEDNFAMYFTNMLGPTFYPIVGTRKTDEKAVDIYQRVLLYEMCLAACSKGPDAKSLVFAAFSLADSASSTSGKQHKEEKGEGQAGGEVKES